MNITITGSLGHISLPLTQRLVSQNHSVCVITRNAGQRRAIETLGATAAIGSIGDAGFLAQAFSGADAVYCMTPPDFSQADQVAYYQQTASWYADAVASVGVKRVVYLSSYGAHLPSGTGYITGSYRAEQVLNTVSDVSLTHVRPTFFYYNLFGFIPMIKAVGYLGAVYGGADRLAMVAPGDIAAVIAEELIKTGECPKVRYVTSDDRPCGEVARVLGEAIGKPGLEWRVLSRGQALSGLMNAGMPANAAANLVELGEAIHSGILRADFEKHRNEKGEISLEQFANDFAKAFFAS